MKQKLFDLLSENEILAIRGTTDIRNVYVKDITVEELDQLCVFLKYKDLNFPGQVAPVIALNELLSRLDSVDWHKIKLRNLSF